MTSPHNEMLTLADRLQDYRVWNARSGRYDAVPLIADAAAALRLASQPTVVDAIDPITVAPPAGDAGAMQEALEAKRYRWLRDPKTNAALVLDKRTGESARGLHGEFNGYDYEYRAGDELDAAIDAAMSSDGGVESRHARSVSLADGSRSSDSTLGLADLAGVAPGPSEPTAASAQEAVADTDMFLDRTEVRCILIGQPDENLDITEGILAEIDALPIHTRTDIARPAAKPDVEGWQSPDKAPRDGTPIEARYMTTMRYQPYKPNSEQRRKGIIGRWQALNEYGGWENCAEPSGEWRAISQLISGATP